MHPQNVAELHLPGAAVCSIAGRSLRDPKLSDGLPDQQTQEVEAVGRALKGEHPRDVAREFGLSPAAMNRTADDLILSRDFGIGR